MTAVAPICAGRDLPLVGTTDGSIRRFSFGMSIATLTVAPGWFQTLKVVVPLPGSDPNWVSQAAYDPLFARVAAGSVSGGSGGSSWELRCGTNAVPVGMGIYRNGPQGPSIGVGLVCVRQD